MQKPPRQPATPEPEPASVSPLPEEDVESAAPVEGEAEAGEGPDPYDDLWDPDMDTRPERIKRTPKARPRGRGAPRGKRRDEA